MQPTRPITLTLRDELAAFLEAQGYTVKCRRDWVDVTLKNGREVLIEMSAGSATSGPQALVAGWGNFRTQGYRVMKKQWKEKVKARLELFEPV